ncbi:hypothetical protein D3C80_1253170 [compost metagenome]
MHLLQGADPARVHVFDVIEQRLQVAGDDCQRRTQLMGHVGDEILSHLFELVDTRDIAHQHQVFVVAVAGDVQLHAQVVVDRRGDFQRFEVVRVLEIFLEPWMSNQVGDWLAAVLRRFQAKQGFGGAVPPFKVAIAVEHDHGVLERGSGLLDAIDDRLQATPHALIAPLQVVDAVEDLAP